MLSSEGLQSTFIDDQGFDWSSGQVQTPVSITGVLHTYYDFNLELFPGWFTLSFQSSGFSTYKFFFEEITKTFCKAFTDEIIAKSIPAYGYSCGLSTALGASIYYSPDLLHFTIKLPETYCRKFQTDKLLLNVNRLINLGGKITRMDHTIDDFSKQLSIKYIHDTKLTGEMVSKVSTVGYATKHRGHKIRFECATLGSRESLLFSRIYDKSVESKGKIDAIRWELEFKSEFATASFEYIFKRSFPYWENLSRRFEFSADGYKAAILAILSSRFDFRDPSSSNQKFRRERSQWFERFLDGIDKAIISLPKIEPSIDKTINWVRDQVGTSLNILSKFFGDNFLDFLSGVIDYSEPKLTRRHLAVLQE